MSAIDDVFESWEEMEESGVSTETFAKIIERNLNN